MSIFDFGYYVSTLSVKNRRHYYQSFLFIKFEPKSWTGIWYTCYQFTPVLQLFILIAKFFNTQLQFTVIRHSEYNFFIEIFHVYSKLKQVKLTFSQLALWYFLCQFQNQKKKSGTGKLKKWDHDETKMLVKVEWWSLLRETSTNYCDARI